MSFQTYSKLHVVKTGGLWLFHWLLSNYLCQGPEKYDKREER